MSIAKLGTEFTVEASADDRGTAPTIAGNADGSFAIAWEGPYRPPADPDGGPNYYEDVYARLFAPAGPTTDDILVNTERRDPQFAPDITTAPNGSFIVGYDSGVEDQLEGTFLAHQQIGANGAKLGDEVYSSDYTYYNINPDSASFSDGTYVLVAREENVDRAFIYTPAGEQQSQFNFGYSPSETDGTASVSIIDQSHILVAWAGYAEDSVDDDSDDLGTRGIWAGVATKDGTLTSTTLLVDYDDIHAHDTRGVTPVTKVLQNGDVAVAFNATDDATGKTDIFLALRDLADERVPPTNLTAALAGNQHAPDLAVLADGRFVVVWQDDAPAALGDSSGSGIVAQVFNADGTYDQGPFLVNSTTAGDQTAPSVAATGNDFVVTWQGPDGIEAQRFDADAHTLPHSYILDRTGTRDGSDPHDQHLTSNAGPTSFYFDTHAHSGHDTVDLGNTDVIVTNQALADPDHDGRIDSSNGSQFALNGSGDTVTVTTTDTLRFLGTRTATDGQTLYAYANYLGFPSLVEGTINKDTLTGTAAKENFFFDTALGLGLGTDQIKHFGPGDRIVTTTPLSDPNHDGIINLDHSDRLVFDTPAEDGASWVKIYNDAGKAVSHLVYDTDYTDGAGEVYYVYKAAGDSSAGHDFLLG